MFKPADIWLHSFYLQVRDEIGMDVTYQGHLNNSVSNAD